MHTTAGSGKLLWFQHTILNDRFNNYPKETMQSDRVSIPHLILSQVICDRDN